MNKEKVEKILGESIQKDGSLNSTGWYLCWNVGDDNATLDGIFDVDDLEAIAWWINNNQNK